MFPGIHLVVDLGDQTIRAYDVGMTTRRLVGGAGTRPVGRAHSPFRVAQQRIREFLILGKLGVCCHTVGTYSENLRVPCFIFLDSITESDAFSRSPTGAGTRIKPENHGFASVVAETHLASRVVHHRKFGRFVTYLDHRFSFRRLYFCCMQPCETKGCCVYGT